MSLSFDDYPELLALRAFVKKHAISVEITSEASIVDQLIPAQFQFNNNTYQIYISDEYNDHTKGNPLLNVILGLYEFVLVDDSTDYLQWCNWLGLKASNLKLLPYYKDMCQHVERLKPHFPENELTVFITDLDFQLNAGAAQYLRSNP